ncbi:hypothetical protein CWC09_19005, partial [Pseudoalteromonas ruthenica]
LAHFDPDGKYGEGSFVILPPDNTSRLHQLLDIIDLQGVDYLATTEELKVRTAKNHLGQGRDATLPKGAIVIPSRQYDAPLRAPSMEFAAEVNDAVQLEERLQPP